uniref:Uncharacterized protein n=1 Tax=Bactrocera dorsalis TaxID=27457 RepID=A0A034VW99_BACDO
MFRPETEDMLPRCAPKPSVPLDMNTAAIVRPTVPEVSILFGAQQGPTTSTSTLPAATSEPTQPTYAAWKKQVLPKVSFPPIGAEVYSINGHVVNSTNVISAPAKPILVNQPSAANNTQITSNVYPQRSIAVNAAPACPVGNSIDVTSRLGGSTQLPQYRRSLDQPLTVQEIKQDNLNSRAPDIPTIMAHQQNQTISTPKPDVLTICAGTQTDSSLVSDFNHIDAALLTRLATKEDIQQLHSIFGELRTDQLRVINLVEKLLNQHQVNSTSELRQDASTQCRGNDCCDNERKTRSPEALTEESNNANYAVAPSAGYQPIKDKPIFPLASPRQPAAQSTAYQPNTPRIIKSSTDNMILNKPNTEQSMLMNELALKYLPNEKLNELLHELNISPTPPKQTTPLRPIENTQKRPSDISNASYKYLQKYRLLPEEQNEIKEQLTPVGSPLMQVAQQQLQHQSPYQHRLASPCILSPQTAMLDLEHIRRQPKLI